MPDEETSGILWLSTTQNPRSFAIIVYVSGLDDKAYVRNPSIVLSLVVLCPLCAADGVEHRLAKNGRYRRFVPVGLRLVWSWIYRKSCRRCGTRFSLLPAFVVAGMTYGRPLVVRWLWACLWGAGSRCRPFLEKHAVHCPAPVELTSWSDLLDDRRSRPGYQLLCRWTRWASEMAVDAMPWLLATFMFLGCDLRRDLVEPLQILRRVPPRAHAVALAMGVWRAVLEASRSDGARVRLHHALPSLIDCLLLLPSDASHGLRRASGAALDYSLSIPAGRAPPGLAI